MNIPRTAAPTRLSSASTPSSDPPTGRLTGGEFDIGMVKNTCDRSPWHCCQRAVVTSGDLISSYDKTGTSVLKCAW